MGDELEKSFLKAYDAYADDIYRHCFFHTFSKELAEEITQDSFVKVWNYLKSGQKIDNIRAFLYRVAKNLIIDEFRKKKTESLDALMEKSEYFNPVGEDEKDLERHVLLREIKEVIEKLPEDEKEIITMRYVDDLDPREIAEILKITPNNASVKINRAMKILQDIVNTGDKTRIFK